MADQSYQLFEYAFRDRGIVAKYITDDTPPQMFANLENCEARQENAISSRLGRGMITTNGTNNVPLADTNVHTLRRLKGTAGTWRYAGAGTNIYRRAGDAIGAYATINGGFVMSGNRFSAEVYRPSLSSFPYLYFADQAQMLKDNGSGNMTKWGILPPTIPLTQVLFPNSLFDIGGFQFAGQAGNYATQGVSGFGQTNRLTGVTVAAPVTQTGLNTLTPSSMANIQAGMDVVYDPAGVLEVIQIISVTATTFTAFFVHLHGANAAVQDIGYGGNVAANTTATVSKAGALNLASIGGNPSPVTDFINLFLNISDPSQIQQAQILFDVGDGSFTKSYYMTTIQASQLQSLISGTQTPGSALSAGVAARAAGQFSQPVLGHNFQAVLPVNGGNTPLPPFIPNPLNLGLSQWTLLQVQKQKFITVGQAGQPGFDWSAVNAWRIVVQTTPTGSLSFSVDDFYLMGGSALSSLGGVGYDYRYTGYNINTGDESNGSQTLISSILSMNQPISVSFIPLTDPQVTHHRLYRRGGAITDGQWHLVATVPIGTTTFLDTIADAIVVAAPTLALDNDAPVTSTLPVPVNTNLGTGVPGGTLVTVTPGSIANIFPNQVMFVDFGTPQAETIYVNSVNVGAGTFTAFFQNAHLNSAVIQADTQPNTPMNLLVIAFDIAWVAGDPNNPHILYFSKITNPAAFPPQNALEIGKPDDPITALVKYRGLLYVFTVSAIYSVYAPSGAAPQVYDTAEVTYGCVANFGFCVGNGEIKYQAADGIRRFSGGASTLMTLNVDWLQTGKTYGPIIPANPQAFSSTLMAYYNRIMYVSYVDINGIRRRLMWNDSFSRFRNDDQICNSMFVEKDTNKLLFGDFQGNVFQDRVNDFDDSGFIGGVQQKTPIPMTLQTESLNQGKRKILKNYQEVTLKIDTQGQPVNVSLVFNDGSGPTVNVGNITQNGIAVVNLPAINGGQGQLAYNVSLLLTGNVTSAVTVSEFAVKFVWDTDTRQVLDTWWLDDNSPEYQMLKQGWFNYVTPSSQPITVNIFIDGNTTVPEFTFVLPATTVRQPFRQRFSPFKCRTYRIIATSTADFRWYAESFVERKPVSGNKGYQRKQIQAQAA